MAAQTLGSATVATTLLAVFGVITFASEPSAAGAGTTLQARTRSNDPIPSMRIGSSFDARRVTSSQRPSQPRDLPTAPPVTRAIESPEARSGYNDDMARTRKVGARELKTRLGKYIRAVQAGATFVVTERGEPVAELRPLAGQRDVAARLDALAAAGVISRGTGEPLPPFEAVPISGSTASSAILEDREDCS